MRIARDLQLGLSCFTGALSCCCLVWRRVELGQDVDLLVSGNGIDQRQPTVGASLGLWASMDPSCCCIHVAGNMHAPVLLCTVYHIIIRKILPRRKGRFRIINNVTYIKLMFLARRRVCTPPSSRMCDVQDSVHAWLYAWQRQRALDSLPYLVVVQTSFYTLDGHACTGGLHERHLHRKCGTPCVPCANAKLPTRIGLAARFPTKSSFQINFRP